MGEATLGEVAAWFAAGLQPRGSDGGGGGSGGGGGGGNGVGGNGGAAGGAEAGGAGGAEAWGAGDAERGEGVQREGQWEVQRGAPTPPAQAGGSQSPRGAGRGGGSPTAAPRSPARDPGGGAGGGGGGAGGWRVCGEPLVGVDLSPAERDAFAQARAPLLFSCTPPPFSFLSIFLSPAERDAFAWREPLCFYNRPSTPLSFVSPLSSLIIIGPLSTPFLSYFLCF